MREFAYERPPDAAAAVAAADGAQTMYLGGGTNLVDLMKLGVEAPARLVDVSRLSAAIEELPGDGLRIGAGVRNADLAVAVRDRFPVLSEALLAGASGQLRNVATVGGNLLQRTRCAYFQDVSKPCNKRQGGRGKNGCPAREGQHRNLAILGHSEHCVATHPSDMAVALTALDAQVGVLGPGGKRTIPMPGLHRLPGDAPERDTVLEPGELITHVDLETLRGPSAYRKVRDRASFSFAVVSIAVAGGRIAFGGLAHAPWRAERAEAALRDGATSAEAADAELTHAEPLRDNAFKVTLARNLLVRTLEEMAT